MCIRERICAYTSHFPHLVAFLLIELLEDKMGQQNVLDCIGTGFRDTTRIAASDEEIWSEIFINNRENMLRTIEKFKKNLGKIEKWIKESDVENLKIWIEKVKEARMRI
ncbi:MAG: prephenate dehydrogenase/arogenate dehydrogenase family protein, partial [bacterium]|nr:prephenate dehydrogenase/arogenate dehydrogenase family protein [bacterium]